MDPFLKELKKYGKIKRGAALKKLSTFRVGGLAECLVVVDSTEKLVELLNFLSGQDIRYFILGGGSNVLFPDGEWEGVMVKVKTEKISVEGETITAEAGAPLSAVVVLASSSGLSGLEWAIGIPGTIGGAIRGNAGAMGENTGQSVESVKYWQDNEVRQARVEDCGFGYRTSYFKENPAVVLSVKFKLKKEDPKIIAEKTAKVLFHRQGKFPTLPSAGSFFQNIPLKDWPGDVNELPELFRQRGTVPVGWLAENLGLKGKRLGDAGVSPEHGNFIVNYGQASSEEIKKLVEEFKQKVYDTYGVELKPEVEIVE